MNFIIASQCAHSGRPLRIEIDSTLKLHSVSAGAEPYIFIPGIDLGNIAEESIIDVF